MKIKVCGMKYPDNIRLVAGLPIDMMGFIFYPQSSRYVAFLDPGVLSEIPPSIRKVGVFVNEPIERILEIMKKYDLQAAQLHGNESPELCRLLKNEGYQVLKAFNISASDDFQMTISYEKVCDYFLFDSKTVAYGGSGKQFDWDILTDYKGRIPFFLSGGIGFEDVERLRNFKYPMFYGIDVNSRFETAPGEKNIEMLVEFLNKYTVY